MDVGNVQNEQCVAGLTTSGIDLQQVFDPLDDADQFNYVLPSQENTHENTLPDTDVLEADGDAFHLIEDDDYRDNDEVYCRESDSSSDPEDEAVAQHNDSDSRVPLYPRATMAVTESSISIIEILAETQDDISLTKLTYM